MTTFAGSTQGFVNATGTAAQFDSPFGLTVDASGNIYVADTDNNRIRKVTTAGVVTTLAGSGAEAFANGSGTAASFYWPTGVTVDASGNVYVADLVNNRIRKITSAGLVTTLAGSGVEGFADGGPTTAQFNNPYGLSFDAAGNLIVADASNFRIRKVTSSGTVTTIAGSTQGFADGPAATALFNTPSNVALDAMGNIFVADSNNHRIRKIDMTLNNPDYLLDSQVIIYPNPATSIIYLEVKDLIATKIKIFDLNGRLLSDDGIIDNKAIIDISNLAKGVYVVEIISNDRAISKKIIKQ